MMLETCFLVGLEILGIRRACKAPIFDFGLFCLFLGHKVPKSSIFRKILVIFALSGPVKRRKRPKSKIGALHALRMPKISNLTKKQVSSIIFGRDHSIHRYSRFKIFNGFPMYGISYIFPKTYQLRDITESQWKKIFQFCKKFLKVQNSYF